MYTHAGRPWSSGRRSAARPCAGPEPASGSIVTVDGRPVAQLGPLDAVTGQVTLDDLVARGLVTPPRRTDPLPATDPVPVWSGARLDRLLRELRG